MPHSPAGIHPHWTGRSTPRRRAEHCRCLPHEDHLRILLGFDQYSLTVFEVDPFELKQYQARMKGKRMYSERYCALWLHKERLLCLFRRTNVLSEAVLSLSQMNNLTKGQKNGTILSEVYLDSGCSVRKRIIQNGFLHLGIVWYKLVHRGTGCGKGVQHGIQGFFLDTKKPYIERL